MNGGTPPGAAIDSTADPSRPIITWTLGQGHADTFVMAGFASDVLRWTILAPPTATEIKMPELPDDLASSRPTSTTILQPPLVVVFSATQFPAYAAFRVPHGGKGFAGLDEVIEMTGRPLGTRVLGAAINIGN